MESARLPLPPPGDAEVARVTIAVWPRASSDPSGAVRMRTVADERIVVISERRDGTRLARLRHRAG